MRWVLSKGAWALVVALGAVHAPAAFSQTVLSKGVTVSSISGAKSSTKDYSLVVPAGATALSFKLSGGTGDADLYVRRGALATTSTNDCASTGSTNSETCSFATPSAATYFVRVQGYASYSGASLVGNLPWAMCCFTSSMSRVWRVYLTTARSSPLDLSSHSCSIWKAPSASPSASHWAMALWGVRWVL